jgi:hypothetical protein
MEVRITVHEFATPEITSLQFFARADIELNQRLAPFQPCGWSNTLSGALAECLNNVRRFEYQGSELASNQSTD